MVGLVAYRIPFEGSLPPTSFTSKQNNIDLELLSSITSGKKRSQFKPVCKLVTRGDWRKLIIVFKYKNYFLFNSGAYLMKELFGGFFRA